MNLLGVASLRQLKLQLGAITALSLHTHQLPLQTLNLLLKSALIPTSLRHSFASSEYLIPQQTHFPGMVHLLLDQSITLGFRLIIPLFVTLQLCLQVFNGLLLNLLLSGALSCIKLNLQFFLLG